MNPSDINDLLRQSRTAYERDPKGIHTFALYWITWEAYRTRLLAVSARLKGWRIRDAYFAIGLKRISNQAKYAACFKAITDVDLANQRGLTGRVWRNLNALEILRHRLIHGYKRANPDLVEKSSRFMNAILDCHESIFGTIQLSKGNEIIRIGDVLRQRPADGRAIPIHRDIEDLFPHFDLNPDAHLKPLPNQSVISAMARIVDELAL